MAWKDLSITEKSNIISEYLDAGYSSLKEIKELYDNSPYVKGEKNLFDDGGELEDSITPTFLVDIGRRKTESGAEARNRIRNLAVNTAYDIPEGVSGYAEGFGDVTASRKRDIRRFDRAYNKALKIKNLTDREKELLTKNLNHTITSEEFGELSSPRLSTLKSLLNEDVVREGAAKGALGATAILLSKPAVEGMLAGYEALPAGVRMSVDALGAMDGLINAMSNNGIRKTARHIKNKEYGRATLSGIGDLFDLAGVSDIVRVGSRIANPAYRAYHAYNTIEPFGYDNAFSRGETWLKSMIENKKYTKPIYNLEDTMYSITPGLKTGNYTKTRDDAWRIYLGMEPNNGFYIKNADGTYSYNINKLKELSDTTNERIGDLIRSSALEKFDYVGLTHGGLWGESGIKDIYEPQFKDGRFRTFQEAFLKDLWDLQPFQRMGDSIPNRMGAALKNKIPFWNSVVDKVTDSKVVNRLLNSEKIKNFEVGKLLGGKPFMMETRIPITSTTTISDYFLPKTVTELGIHPYGDQLLSPIDKFPNFNIKQNNIQYFLNLLNNLQPVKHKMGGNLYETGGLKEGIQKLFAPTYDTGTFGEAFRQARIDNKDFFKWNGERYSTEMLPTIHVKDTKLKIPGVTKKQLNTMQHVWDYLRNNNVSARNAAAVMGNIMQESAFNPAAVQEGGDSAVGLFQMHGQRLKDYKDYLKEKTLEDSMDNQLGYMIDVMRGKRQDFYMNEYNRVKDSLDSLKAIESPSASQKKALDVMQSYYDDYYKKRAESNRLYPISDFTKAFDDEAVSIEDLTDLFTNTIERAGKPEYKKRRGYAKNIYNYFYGVPTIQKTQNE